MTTGTPRLPLAMLAVAATVVLAACGASRPVPAVWPVGSAPVLVPALRSASVVNASPADAPRAYFRAPGRAAPHNLSVRPALLPTGVA